MSRDLLLIICKYNINTVKRHHQLENWAPHQTVSHWTKALNGYACNMKWYEIVIFFECYFLLGYCWVEEGWIGLWSTRTMIVMMSLWWVGCNRTGQGCLEGSSPLLHRHPRTYQRRSFFSSFGQWWCYHNHRLWLIIITTFPSISSFDTLIDRHGCTAGAK